MRNTMMHPFIALCTRGLKPLKWGWALLALWAMLPGWQAQAQVPQYVGIPAEQMDYYASAQVNSQWCWAASIQMVLNYYGVAINQEDIVRRTYGRDPYGRLPNFTGSIGVIHQNLNNWSLDAFGQQYRVSAQLGQGAPTPAILLQELRAGRPVIIGYRSGPGSGHAVVITGLSYIERPQGPEITSIIVRDPWPSPQNRMNNGRTEYPAAMLAQRIMAYWYVRVQR